MFATIAQFFKDGGVTMYITATAGIIGVAIVVDKSKKLFREYSHDSQGFMARIKELMLQNRIEDAIQLCNLQKTGLLPKVIKSGLERTGCDEDLVAQSMEGTYLEHVPKVTDRLAYLSLIANAGMLFGLLGTVVGLIKQFSALASVEAADKQLLMAQGIAHAMNNTALGLIVALPCLLAHGVLSGKATKILEEMERGSAQFLDWMGLYNYGELRTRLAKNGHAKVSKLHDAVEKKAA